MPRNKRTDVLAHEDLAPLTERILSRMGPEGARIRRRLKEFIRERARPVFIPPRDSPERDR